MKWLALLVVCIACTRTSEVKLDAQEDLHVAEQAKKKEHVTETVQTGPETITTTVEEWEAPKVIIEGAISDAAEFAIPGSSSRPLQAAQLNHSMAASPILVKRTVTVDQRGPVVDAKTNDSCEDVGLDLTKKVIVHKEDDNSTSWGPPWWLWLVGAGAICAGGFVAWKLKPPWLTAAIAICKRL